MSAKNFYHTLYQTDQLFRIAGESWAIPDSQPEKPAEESLPETQTDEVGQTAGQRAPDPIAGTGGSADLVSDLEALALRQGVLPTDIVRPEAVANGPLVIRPEPEPRVIITTSELLPQPAPRPTTPSILPPVQQQPRMPQLNHKVLLLADEELDPSNLLFLEKILKAVNLNVNGVDLLNLNGARDMNFAELLQEKYINHFITFGVPFERINLDIMMDRYAPVRFEGITFLMADALPVIEADQNLKKRLWAALQRVFLQR